MRSFFSKENPSMSSGKFWACLIPIFRLLNWAEEIESSPLDGARFFGLSELLHSRSELELLPQSLFKLRAIGSANSRYRTVFQDHVKFAMGDRLEAQMLSILTLAKRWMRTKRTGSSLSASLFNAARYNNSLEVQFWNPVRQQDIPKGMEFRPGKAVGVSEGYGPRGFFPRTKN
jgi:hypothetical protein